MTEAIVMRWCAAGLLIIAPGCGEVGGRPRIDGSVDAPGDASDDAPSDTPIDAPARCDPSSTFGTPMPIPGLAMPGSTLFTPQLSEDERTVYFSVRPAGGTSDLFTATRASRDLPFENLKVLAGPNSPSDNDDNPSVSANGRTVWFESGRPANPGSHLYTATRASSAADFGSASLAPFTVAGQQDLQPFLTGDGIELWFTSNRPGGPAGFNLWHAVAGPTGLGAPSLVPNLSSMQTEYLPMLSADRRTVYFSSDRGGPGTKGRYDIFVARRGKVDEDFSTPMPVAELNTTGDDFATWLSSDDCRVYGKTDTGPFIAIRPPI